MKRVALLAALALAACDAPAPRVDTAGATARAEVDRLTKTYTECIEGHAAAMPVADDTAGALADTIVKSCRPARNALFAKVADFDRLGHPTHSREMAEAVAQASVATLDDALRQTTVVTIIKRQQGIGDAPATPGTRI
ncbi:hypothetical protein IP88_03500 [alpha proteobacterium AAP81b]|nr:hypothetical protein IP88_03500 [alpha proteobacterium AAP81b]